MGPGGANTSEGVLANFFNSLLNKKTGQGMAGSPGAQQIKPPGANVNDECKYTQNFLLHLTLDIRVTGIWLNQSYFAHSFD